MATLAVLASAVDVSVAAEGARAALSHISKSVAVCRGLVIYLCMYVYMYIGIYVYRYLCIQVYMYICILVYRYICRSIYRKREREMCDIYIYRYVHRCMHIFVY